MPTLKVMMISFPGTFRYISETEVHVPIQSDGCGDDVGGFHKGH